MIKLKNGYTIKSDKTQYMLILERIGTKKETNEQYTYETNEGYYSSLEQCLQSYIRKQVMNKIADEDIELKGVLEEIKKLRKEIQAYD